MSNVVDFSRFRKAQPEDPFDAPEAVLVAGASGAEFSVYYVGRDKEFMLVNNFDDTALAFKPEQLSGLYTAACDTVHNTAEGISELEDIE